MEANLCAHVVAAGPAIATAPARNSGLDAHPLPDAQLGHLRPERDHPPARLVAEDERLGHDPRADPAVLVVVDIEPQMPTARSIDQHLVRPRRRDGALLDPKVAGPVEDSGAVSLFGN